ncbi:transposase, partial [Rhodococcus opacus RKJ300 = JCM 13270]
KSVSAATGIDIYFCDPHAPWQRGSNENTNGILRQYFPKGSDLSVHSKADLEWVSRQLNERPRKRLEFRTPIEEMERLLLSMTARIRRSATGNRSPQRSVGATRLGGGVKPAGYTVSSV